MAVRGVSLDQCEVGGQAVLEEVLTAIEVPLLLAVRQFGGHGGRSVERRNARAPGTYALGKRALGNQFEFGESLAVQFREDRRVG